MDDFRENLREKAKFQGNAYSVGGYGNPMPIYLLDKLEIRLRRSVGTVGKYHPTCVGCSARFYCRDGTCNVEIGPDELIKVCKPKEGKIFKLGQEREALEYIKETRFEKTSK